MDPELLLSLIVITGLSWLVTLVLSLLRPYRLFNSVFLMWSLIISFVFLIYLFTKDLGSSMLIAVIAGFLMLLLVPFLLIMNGITMIRMEGRSFANLLSLLLGIGIEIGELSLISDVVFNYSMGIGMFQKMSMFLLFVGISVFFFSSLILLFVVYMIFFQFVPHRNDFDYIIIHGCGLLQGDQVSKLLANRIDRAIRIFHLGNERAMIICSGGQGSNEKISEAEAISRYLRQNGIDEEHILLEDRSVSTKENLLFSYDLIRHRGKGSKIALVSSNYHIFRCVLLAHQLDIPCVGIGARTAFYYWPSAVIREFVAVYSDRKRLFWTLLAYLLVISPFIFVLAGRP
jgi:vancomycin permeability regulator SanA